MPILHFFSLRKIASNSLLLGLFPAMLPLIIALAGFWDSHAAAAATVRVGISNSSSDVAFFIADKKGYFKQEGRSLKNSAPISQKPSNR